MLAELHRSDLEDSDFIRLNEAAPPIPVPAGHVGPVMLPGTGRMVWWTGRVAIGLRHQAPQHYETLVDIGAVAAGPDARQPPRGPSGLNIGRIDYPHALTPRRGT